MTLSVVCSVSAQTALPYSQRTAAFSGMGTAVQGDIRTVGMGGATVGLADTFIAAVDNPAGLAMTVGVGDIHYVTNTIHDAHLQRFDDAPETQSIGLALGLYPWALAVGYLSRYHENGTYQLPFLTPKPLSLDLSTRDLIFSGARLFFHNRLSVGVELIVGQANRSMSVGALRIDDTFNSYTVGYAAGVSVQLPRRFLVGASFTSAMSYSGAPSADQAKLIIPGFFQSVDLPWRASVGGGFIPNRFFRADITLNLVGETPHAALIRDQNARVGQHLTLQPHAGLAYVFADFKELKATLFAGTYYETSRISDSNSRIHGTVGAEARIWVITFGAGLDFAERYRNYQFSVGVDVFGLLARVKVIPQFWTPPSDQILPPAFRPSDVGLARPLVSHWAPAPTDIDPIKVGLAIPKKLGAGIHNAAVGVESFGHTVAAGMEATNETPAEKRERARRAAEEAKRQAAAQVEAEKAREDAAAAIEEKREEAMQEDEIRAVIEKEDAERAQGTKSKHRKNRKAQKKLQ